MANLLNQFIASSDKKLLSKIRRAISNRLSEIESAERCMLPEEKTKFRSKSYNESMRQLLDDDWSELFHFCKSDHKDFYVYFHGDPKNKKRYTELEVNSFAKPIYVGMGRGARAFNFNRSPTHLTELHRLMSTGYTREEIVHVVASGLTELEARQLESKLILFFGIKLFKQKSDRRMGGFNNGRSLLNSQYENMPDMYKEFK